MGLILLYLKLFVDAGMVLWILQRSPIHTIYTQKTKFPTLSCLDIILRIWSVSFLPVELLASLTDLNLGYFCSTDSFFATINWIWGFNIPNESYWHEDDNINVLLLQKAYYLWRYGSQNLGSQSEKQKKGRKIEGYFPSFIII